MNPAEFPYLAALEESFWWFRGMRSIMFALLDPLERRHQIRQVLEAGCGTGHFAHLLHRRYGWEVYPVDLAWEGLSYAHQAGIPHLAQADIRALPFQNGCFDAVFCLDVLVHFAPGEEAEAVKELVRVLRQGGLLVLRVAALRILRSRHSEFTNERQRFTAGRLRRIVVNYGVQPLRITYANSCLLPIALVKFRVWEPLWKKPPASGVAPLPRWLNGLLSVPLELERCLLKAGLNLPVGQSLILVGLKKG